MPSETVKVMVRVRPMNQREKDRGCNLIVNVEQSNSQIILTNPNEVETQKVFAYDAVFSPNCTQQSIYEEAAFQLVESVIEGYNGTIFAYGQTGCGKTHTMMGDPSNEEKKGVIPRAFAHIFGSIESQPSKNFLIRCSYIEIYNEEIHDLIGKDPRAKLDLKEAPDKGIFIKDLSMHAIKSVAEIEKLMIFGTKNRSVGETAMNKDSSRSHSIFTIYIETSENDAQGQQKYVAGKLNLVDLAGSERQSKTGATGERLKEANKINLSLSALGNVISALVDGKSSHIPYRDSKLTRLLQDSLGGNTKTIMIANISPSSDNYDETLGTLRYAARAKNIKNQPKVNEDPKDALLREYAEEIKRLKQMLESGMTIGNAKPSVTITPVQNISSDSTNTNPVNISIEQIRSKSEQITFEETVVINQVEENKQKAIEINLEQEQKLKDEINEERRKREELENLMKEMEQKLLKGGSVPAEDPEEKIKYNEMLNRLKTEKKKQEQLIQEKQQKEEEIINIEKKYDSLQEEVEELRKVVKKLKKKYRDSLKEIKDLNEEHESNREELLDTIRLQEKDIKLNNAIIMSLVTQEELEKIKAKAKWNDDRNDYVVPPVIIQNNKLKLPKLQTPQGNVIKMVQEEWRGREIEFLEVPTAATDPDFDDTSIYLKNNNNVKVSRERERANSRGHSRKNSSIRDRRGNQDNINSNINNLSCNITLNNTQGFINGANNNNIIKFNNGEYPENNKGEERSTSQINESKSRNHSKPPPKKIFHLEPLNPNNFNSNPNNQSGINDDKIEKKNIYPSPLPSIKSRGQRRILNSKGGIKLTFKANLLLSNENLNQNDQSEENVEEIDKNYKKVTLE